MAARLATYIVHFCLFFEQWQRLYSRLKCWSSAALDPTPEVFRLVFNMSLCNLVFLHFYPDGVYPNNAWFMKRKIGSGCGKTWSWGKLKNFFPFLYFGKLQLNALVFLKRLSLSGFVFVRCYFFFSSSFSVSFLEIRVLRYYIQLHLLFVPLPQALNFSSRHIWFGKIDCLSLF